MARVGVAEECALIDAAHVDERPIHEHVVREPDDVAERLGVDVYRNRPDCRFISYDRGTFQDNLDNLACWVDGFEATEPFDAQAIADFQSIEVAFGEAGVGAVRSLSVERDADGNVGPGTFFVADARTTYSYYGDTQEEVTPEPGALEKIRSLGSGWYLIDAC